jgi:hypothetical protein
MLMIHFGHTGTPPPTTRDNQHTAGVLDSSLRRLKRRAIETFCAAVIVFTLIGSIRAEEPAGSGEPLSLPTTETSTQSPAVVDSIPVDPYIRLRGSVWRTKAGIVFLKTPIGLLTLSSKTTLKDLKASQEVHFWLHERHSVIEIRKRADGSLVHRYLSGPMNSISDSPKTLRWWGPDGDHDIAVGTQEELLNGHREGDPLTVEVDETNNISGVHDLQFDLQVSQVPPAGADVQLLLSGTVSKVKSNFVFVRTPVGLVMLNSKIGVPRVKAGQPLTLHIDQDHVTVTFPSTETASPRRSASPIP